MVNLSRIPGPGGSRLLWPVAVGAAAARPPLPSTVSFGPRLKNDPGLLFAPGDMLWTPQAETPGRGISIIADVIGRPGRESYYRFFSPEQRIDRDQPAREVLGYVREENPVTLAALQKQAIKGLYFEGTLENANINCRLLRKYLGQSLYQRPDDAIPVTILFDHDGNINSINRGDRNITLASKTGPHVLHLTVEQDETGATFFRPQLFLNNNMAIPPQAVSVMAWSCQLANRQIAKFSPPEERYIAGLLQSMDGNVSEGLRTLRSTQAFPIDQKKARKYQAARADFEESGRASERPFKTARQALHDMYQQTLMDGPDTVLFSRYFDPNYRNSIINSLKYHPRVRYAFEKILHH